MLEHCVIPELIHDCGRSVSAAEQQEWSGTLHKYNRRHNEKQSARRSRHGSMVQLPTASKQTPDAPGFRLLPR